MKPLIELDPDKPVSEQRDVIQNRYHPDIPAVVNVKPGDDFIVECLDWTAGKVKNNDSANDIRDMDFTPIHHLSGPIHVDGAEPGDMLVVDILDVGTHPKRNWGYTGIWSQENGGGFLTDHFPNAHKLFGILKDHIVPQDIFQVYVCQNSLIQVLLPPHH